MRPESLPARLLIDSSGTAVSPGRCGPETDIDIVFVRNDGWSLGAPTELEAVAFSLWADSWVAFRRAPDYKRWPMTAYRGPLESG